MVYILFEYQYDEHEPWGIVDVFSTKEKATEFAIQQMKYRGVKPLDWTLDAMGYRVSEYRLDPEPFTGT